MYFFFLPRSVLEYWPYSCIVAYGLRQCLGYTFSKYLRRISCNLCFKSFPLFIILHPNGIHFTRVQTFILVSVSVSFSFFFIDQEHLSIGTSRNRYCANGLAGEARRAARLASCRLKLIFVKYIIYIHVHFCLMAPYRFDDD